MTTTPAPQFAPDRLQEIQNLQKQFPEGKHKSALIRTLHIAQEELGGYLTPAIMDYVAELLQITPIEVYEVATFYSMYHHAPVGKYVLEFCQTGPCYARGVEKMVAYTEQKLGIKNGETTPDGMFTIKCVECLGACGYAPMMQVGEYYHEHLTEQKIDDFVTQAHANNIDKGKW
jgi:NADH-quinone oxidoreductase subunit E